MADESKTHEGHRERMRQRYLATGFDSFQDHEILEMILYNCYSRINTNNIAHRLLENFGSLSAVLEAPVDSLKAAGLSERVAVYLRMIPDIARVYLDDRNNSKDKIISLDNIGEYFVSKFIGRIDEHLILLLMDAKCKELFCGVVASGTSCGSDVPVRQIVDLAMRYNATNAAIAHNHPSGVALPSKTDVKTTNALHSTLAMVGIRLVDHIIVADNDYISLRESSLCSSLITGE
ncbi:MAG: DNA repair protein RadC [Ruminococcaceae bacterium]|nr:DNA repair protein RadC [Oscillospiraceae bacterium]